jgi:hypothetical protein
MSKNFLEIVARTTIALWVLGGGTCLQRSATLGASTDNSAEPAVALAPEAVIAVRAAIARPQYLRFGATSSCGATWCFAVD